jgi:hypothetical protein
MAVEEYTTDQERKADAGAFHDALKALVSNPFTFKHGRSRDAAGSAYGSWEAIKQRCFNPKCPQYRYYGGRGITIYLDWANDFSAFVRDVGERPSLQHSIERIDNNGNYEPGNCRWATKREQVRNRRNNAFVTINGVTKLAIDWSVEFGFPPYTITRRIKKGLIGDDLTAPLLPRGKHRRGTRGSAA